MTSLLKKEILCNGLAHCRVSVAQWLSIRVWNQKVWGLIPHEHRIFFLYPMLLSRFKKTFFHFFTELKIYHLFHFICNSYYTFNKLCTCLFQKNIYILFFDDNGYNHWCKIIPNWLLFSAVWLVAWWQAGRNRRYQWRLGPV